PRPARLAPWRLSLCASLPPFLPAPPPAADRRRWLRPLADRLARGPARPRRVAANPQPARGFAAPANRRATAPPPGAASPPPAPGPWKAHRTDRDWKAPRARPARFATRWRNSVGLLRAAPSGRARRPGPRGCANRGQRAYGHD